MICAKCVSFIFKIKMQVKVLKNFGIVLFGALFGRGLFLIAQEG